MHHSRQNSDKKIPWTTTYFPSLLFIQSVSLCMTLCVVHTHIWTVLMTMPIYQNKKDTFQKGKNVAILSLFWGGRVLAATKIAQSSVPYQGDVRRRNMSQLLTDLWKRSTRSSKTSSTCGWNKLWHLMKQGIYIRPYSWTKSLLSSTTRKMS